MRKIGDESGQTLVMVALSMAVLLGFAALATDVGVMLHEKRLVQSAADSAAVAAAVAKVNGEDPAVAAVNDATANGFTDASNCGSGSTVVCVSVPPTDGHFVGLTGYVEATVTQQTPTFFMHLFGQDSMNVSARAVATYLGNSSGCIYVLNPTNAALSANPWGNSTISAPDCGILVNGNVKLGASDSVEVGYLGATGGITGTRAITGTYSQGISEFSDPMAGYSEPDALPTKNSDGTTCSVPKGADGVTSACFLNQPLSGTLLPGIYYYTDPTKATYTGAVDGSAGVTLVLTNGSILSTSGASGAGNASLNNMTAPKTGFYSGIVLDAPNYAGELNLDFGATVTTWYGDIYAPLADLSLQDQGANGKTTTGVGVTVNGKLIIGTLDVYDKNNGNLTVNDSSTSGSSPIPRISLVE